MQSLEQIFITEFKRMMSIRKMESGYVDIANVPLPSKLAGKLFIEKNELCYIHKITDEYYSQLNNTEVKIFPKVKLNRRKFDHKGEFIKNKDDSYVLEDVPLPHGCIAILSDIRLGVPTKYKPNDNFAYVDFLCKEINGVKVYKYIYIVPKKYCYKLNQTALVLSWKALQNYYSGIKLALQNGHYLYMYIVPYKPNTRHNYRVLHCKTTDDFSEEITTIRNFWLENNIIFNPADCELIEGHKGEENLAYSILNGVYDSYERYNPEKTMDKDVDMFEYAEIEGVE